MAPATVRAICDIAVIRPKQHERQNFDEEGSGNSRKGKFLTLISNKFWPPPKKNFKIPPFWSYSVLVGPTF